MWKDATRLGFLLHRAISAEKGGFSANGKVAVLIAGYARVHQ